MTTQVQTTRDEQDDSRGRKKTDVEVAEDSIQQWRGVGAEDSAELSAKGSVFLKHRSRRLLGDLLAPYKLTVVFMIVLVVIENAARLAIPYLVSLGIDKGVPPIMNDGPPTVLVQVVIAMLVTIVFQAVTRIGFQRLSGRVGQDVLLEVRRRVFKHFQKLDVKFHDRYTSGRVVSRLTSDVEAIQEMLNGGFDSLIRAVLTLVGVGIMLITMDAKLGIVCLLSFPLLMLLVRWFSVNSSKTYRKVREFSAMVIVQFVETMTGIRAVQAYRREPRNAEIFEDMARGFRDINTKAFRLVALFMPGVKLIGNVTIGIVVLYGGFRALEGDLTVGVLTAFLLYLRMFFDPMQDISQFYNLFQSASAALEKLSGVLEQDPEVEEPTEPTPIDRAKGTVEFEHVDFGYVDDRPVLPDLDLTIPAGQTVALVGTTGAGKTTIAKMISRFYDPTGGRITLDGTDLRELSDVDLRRNVVMVTQENFMFDGTVADNIAFGKPEASRDEIVAAASAVGAHEFITALPHGYDTDVEKRGGRLSAGQRQLVAFARAFLADPAVLILDEATSSLDIPSERLVQQALQTILASRTAVIIAHRLSTVEIADRVLVLEHGRILEDGSPAELMHAEGGRYAALYDAWEESLA
ncbi:ABC transporter ATP-binding protein [Microlunatus soli]|uniref:ABC-type multidrug transport system, ATPase and permease component n=1 Tax=Microlunatus soli TaxID=630515 RepID=A0A1H1V5U0_9ACTN|nr:ABC transporter ATP-binding protein [Microlunatus soli]SDS80108.1 ABC-type multidrug transport system, ATPase and permease component [Microlunatus soli]